MKIFVLNALEMTQLKPPVNMLTSIMILLLTLLTVTFLNLILQ